MRAGSIIALMAIIRAFLRIGKNVGGRTPYMVRADVKPDHTPIVKRNYPSDTFLPTVSFALDLNIPDEVFERASQVLAQVEVPIEVAEIAVETRRTDTEN